MISFDRPGSRRISLVLPWWIYTSAADEIVRCWTKALVAHFLEQAVEIRPTSRISANFLLARNRGFREALASAISSNRDEAEIRFVVDPLLAKAGVPASIVPNPSISDQVARTVSLLTERKLSNVHCRLYAEVACRLDDQHRQAIIELRCLSKVDTVRMVLMPNALSAVGVDWSIKDAFRVVSEVCEPLDALFLTSHQLVQRYEIEILKHKQGRPLQFDAQ